MTTMLSAALPLKWSVAAPAAFTFTTARYQAKALVSPSAPIGSGSAEPFQPASS